MHNPWPQMKWCVSFLLFEIAIGFCSKAELIQETISSHGDCKKPPKTHTHMQVCMHTCTHIITAQMCSSDVEIVSGCVLVFSLPFLHAHLYLVSGCVLVFSLPFLHAHLYLCNKTLQPPPQVTTKWRKQNKTNERKEWNYSQTCSASHQVITHAHNSRRSLCSTTDADPHHSPCPIILDKWPEEPSPALLNVQLTSRSSPALLNVQLTSRSQSCSTKCIIHLKIQSCITKCTTHLKIPVLHY